jgi:hypothetical protein
VAPYLGIAKSQEPVRRHIHGIETFDVLGGGEYLFIPSFSTLMWLAQKEI